MLYKNYMITCNLFYKLEKKGICLVSPVLASCTFVHFSFHLYTNNLLFHSNQLNLKLEKKKFFFEVMILSVIVKGTKVK